MRYLLLQKLSVVNYVSLENGALQENVVSVIFHKTTTHFLTLKQNISRVAYILPGIIFIPIFLVLTCLYVVF